MMSIKHPSRLALRRRHLPVRGASLLSAIVALCAGCATHRAADQQAQPNSSGEPAVSFKLDVVSDNHGIAKYLERYLDIQRFADFPDLQPTELRQLQGQAESNARDLLAALGYFNPVLDLKADPPAAGKHQWHIVMQVDPGPETRVASHQIDFAEPMAGDPRGADQRDAIRRDWRLEDGEIFSEEQWDAAKTAGLRTLQSLRYPTAHIADSQATIDADSNRAALAVTYDAGPAYRFGALQLEGVDRYDAQGIRNIARLPTGEVYSERKLLDSQQRLIASGYFDSVFMTLDRNERNPDEATVITQLREAKLQKIVFGVGYSTDTGPRASIDHTDNKMPPLGWRALNNLTAGTQTQSLSTNWTAMPNMKGWAWNTGLSLERSDAGDFKSDSLALTGGRAFQGDSIDRRYYLEYDASNAEGSGAPPNSSSLLADYSWIGRYFNDRLNPTGGHGIAFDIGAGLTLQPAGKPFLRLDARALKLWPFGGRNRAGKRSRLALRAEFGTIVAVQQVNIPSRLLFLTGGDTTVRGYSYQSIGARLADGKIYGARNLVTTSVEWQNPVRLFGNSSSFEHVVFVDAGAAADQLRRAVVYPGVGTGLRWSSPIGPMEIDVAYGTRTQNWRLHLRVGFQFQ